MRAAGTTATKRVAYRSTYVHLAVGYPGLRFRMVDEQERIRPHMRVFLDADEVRELAAPVDGGRTLHIVQALSGG